MGKVWGVQEEVPSPGGRGGRQEAISSWKQGYAPATPIMTAPTHLRRRSRSRRRRRSSRLEARMCGTRGTFPSEGGTDIMLELPQSTDR